MSTVFVLHKMSNIFWLHCNSYFFGCSSCRSLLADIVQQEDAKELCRILVLVSGEAAKSHLGMADSKLGAFVGILSFPFNFLLCIRKDA